MAKQEKMTIREHYNRLLTFGEVLADPISVKFINERLALLDKKNASTAATESKEVTEKVIEVIETVITSPLTPTEITKRVQAILPDYEISVQRVSRALTVMIAEGRVSRCKDGRKTYYLIND